MNLKQIKAIEQKNKQRILKFCPDVTEQSGIYVFIRDDEENKTFAYIGQAKHLLTRLAQHLSGYSHIDLSLKKRGLYAIDNRYGWFITFELCELDKLDEMERKYIELYKNAGYELYNKTAGGQGKGKVKIAEFKPAKGYRDGLKQGYKHAIKYVSNLFDKNLIFSINGQTNKNKEKAKQKFENFLKGEIK